MNVMLIKSHWLGLGILEFTCLSFQFGPALRQCIVRILFTISTFHWTTASRKPGLGLVTDGLGLGLAFCGLGLTLCGLGLSLTLCGLSLGSSCPR